MHTEVSTVIIKLMAYTGSPCVRAKLGSNAQLRMAGNKSAITASSTAKYAPKAMRSAVPMVSTLPNRNDDNSGT